jgi:hypothetical protein
MTRVVVDKYSGELEVEAPPDISNEVVQAGMIRALRKKIAALEGFIQKLLGTHATSLSSVSNELTQAQNLVAQLRATLAAAEGRSIETQVRDALLQKFLPRLAGAPARTSGADVLVSLAAVLAVEVLVPDEWTAVKGVARLATAGMAFRAVSDWVQA